MKRIRAEMEKTLEGINFLGTLDQFLAFIRNDPRFYLQDAGRADGGVREDRARHRAAAAEAVRQVCRRPASASARFPAASAPTTTTAYYQPPSLDGSRPGNYYVNLYKPETRPIVGNRGADRARVRARPSPADRAGVRAHGAAGIPPQRGLHGVRRRLGAVLARSLGYELGLYKDDFSKFGQLNYDMWRAVRLVVDTGMHQFKWTRDQAIYYFRQNTGKNQQDIENEVDRYISWPGQALAYKLGQLKNPGAARRSREGAGRPLRYPRIPRPAPRNGRVALVGAGRGNAGLDRGAERAAVIVDRPAAHHSFSNRSSRASMALSRRAQRVSAAARCRLACASM